MSRRPERWARVTRGFLDDLGWWVGFLQARYHY